MSSFKNLNLNHTKIEDAINSYPDTKLLSMKGNNYSIQCDNKIATISIWIKADGTTTLNPNVGKEHALSLLIVEHIIKSTSISDRQSVNYSIKNLADENFSLVLEYLNEMIETLEVNEEEIVNGKKYQLKNTNFKDTFFLIRYSNGNTHLQGKPLSIYSELYSIISELIPSDEIISINNEIFKVSIKKDDIYNELEMLLPTAYSALCDTTKKILMSSVILRKIDVEMDDYSAFSFGSLRGLEAFIKLVLNKKYKTVGRIGEIFKENAGRFEAVLDFKEHVKSNNTVMVVESCYNFYHQNRHRTFHADNVPSMSYIINKEEASRIIDTVCKLIEEGANEIKVL
ncbi:MAG: hypothetical protein FP820_09940 [Sulfurimonas sp.]|nr:hypothetical protein [Sulfurimonas sp.]MBU3939597.1 type II toxin-antitoxin system RnlA family toxin [bacterium]MBU4003002.1 type II toxin-antitoxin system RnlA family toxin [Pseudomonadota bacterium]